MPKTVPCLWFDQQAEQAAALYTAVFPDSEVLKTATAPTPPGPRAP